MTGVLAAQHARPDSAIYDLGCSWGASLLSVARKIDHPSCQLIGIDNSEAMRQEGSPEPAGAARRSPSVAAGRRYHGHADYTTPVW